MPNGEKIKVPRFDAKSGFATTAQRSRMMGQIRGRETQPEIVFRKALWNMGIRYRKNCRQLPGKPDVAIQKYKLAIFIDGAFWHGYHWAEKKTSIKSNRDFWIPKIERNMQRDQEVGAQLEAMGYTVVRFWEHQLKKSLPSCLAIVLGFINGARFVDR
jgi:DNA mismatch endonuclease, patch repair protein